MKKVLVAGATGYLGNFVVKELKKRNYWIRVLIRKESQKEKFNNIEVDEFFIGEITQPKTIIGITENIDWVFTSIGITRQKDGLTYMNVDYQGNLNLLLEAEKSNVEFFEYVSVFGAEKVPELKIIQAKEKFVDRLKQSSIESCIIRPTGFFGDLKELLKMGKGGKMYLIGKGENKINPISGKDLAIVCIDSFEKSKSEVNVGGPKVYTQNQLAEVAFNALKIKGKSIHIPIWVRNLTYTILKTFTAEKFNGPILFFLKAMTMEGATDKYGKEFLEDYFEQEVKNIK
ncbi:MAG TPA: SDR family oxidoreductase [Bacteroidia bacterium]|nr:SDR family oxidoreductase [Bacteroidia bacterium]